MLKYRDVENLPKDHPDMIKFWEELKKMEDAYIGEQFSHNHDDEQSLDYFNRYIAGDR